MTAAPKVISGRIVSLLHPRIQEVHAGDTFDPSASVLGCLRSVTISVPASTSAFLDLPDLGTGNDPVSLPPGVYTWAADTVGDCVSTGWAITPSGGSVFVLWTESI